MNAVGDEVSEDRGNPASLIPDELAEQQRRLDEAQRVGKLGSWEYNPDAATIVWSRNAYALYERDPSRGPPSVGEEAEYYSPEVVERLHGLAAQVLREQRRVEYEFDARLPSGRNVTFWGSMYPGRTGDGRSATIAGVFQDITEQREREREIDQRNQLMSAILGHTHIMTAYLDADFDFVWVNRAYAEACDQLPEFFVGKNHFQLFPHEENQQIFSRVVATGEPYLAEAKPFLHPAQSGRGVTYWDWSLSPVRDARGQVTHLVLSVVDVTRCVRAEAIAHANEERFRALFDHAPVAHQALDLEGRVLEVNESWCRLLGYSREEAVGRSFVSFLRPEFREAGTAAFREFKERGTVAGLELDMLRKDGVEVSVSVDGVVARDAAGGLQQTHCVLTDVTERKRVAHEQARFQDLRLQAQKLEAIGTLAGGVAHDMNNILGGILMFSELLREAPAEATDELDNIASLCRKGRDLTRQLLSFARKGPRPQAPVSIPRLLRDVASIIRRTAPQLTAVEVSISDEVAAVVGDAAQLNSALMNVCLNAVDAVAGKGRIRLVAERVVVGAEEKRRGLDSAPGP